MGLEAGRNRSGKRSIATLLVTLVCLGVTALPPVLVSAAEAPPGSRVVDGFDRVDSGSLGVALSGQAWSDLAGGWEVSAGLAAPESGYSLAVVDGGGADGLVSVSLAEPSAEFWLVLRASDGANYWRFGRWQSGPYQLQQVAGNGLGSPAVTTSATVVPAAGDRIECRLTASRFDCSVNGVVVVSTADRFNGSARLVGFASWSPSGASPIRFDDLVVADVVAGPDLMVSVTDVDPVLLGGELLWTVTVTNVGSGPAGDVSVTSAVPAGVTDVTATSASGVCQIDSSVACSLDPLAAGASTTVEISGLAPPSGSTVVLTVAVSAQGDDVPANDTTSETTYLQAPLPPGSRVVDGFDRVDSGSLGVALSGQAWSDLAGGWEVSAGLAAPESGYSLAVVDGGGADGLVSVSLAEPSAEFWLVLRASDGANYWRFGRWQSGPYQLQQVAGNGLGSPAVTTSATVVPAAGDRIECRLTASRFDCSVNGVVVVSTADRFNGSARLVGFASWSPSGASPIRFDDLVVADVVAGPDLMVSVTDVDPVLLGGELLWTVTVTNVGSGPAGDVSVTSAVPAGVTDVAATSASGVCQIDSSVACSLDPLAAGASTTVEISGLAPPSGSTVVLTVAVSAQGDDVPANDTTSETTYLQAPLPPGSRVVDRFDRPSAANLGLTETGEAWSPAHGSFRIVSGQAVSSASGYDMALVQGGSSPSGAVSVTLAQPSPEFWLVLRASDGANYWRFGRSQSGPYQLQQVTGNALGSPAMATLATVTPMAGDQLQCQYREHAIACSVNGMAVTTAVGGSVAATSAGLASWSSGGSPAPRFDDFLVAEIPAVPDVAVSITDIDPVFTGGQVRWQATVSSVGGATARGVSVTLTLPAAISGASLTTDRGSCALDIPTTCSVGDLAPGQVAVIVVIATAPSEAQALTLSAVLDSAGDASGDNDNDAETTTVRNPPPPGARVVDGFDRTGDGLGFTDTGEPWTTHVGAFSSLLGEARGTTAQLSFASVESGFAYGTFELTVADVGDKRFWAVFRVVDSQNYYRVGPDIGGRYRLEKVVDGVTHGLQFLTERSEILAADGDVLRIVNRSDDGIFVSINGRHLLDAGDVQFMDQTRFGFATASTSVRVGHLDVGQVVTTSVVVTDSFSRLDAESLGAPETGVSYRWWGNLGLTGGQAWYDGSYFGVGILDASSEAADVRVRVVTISDEFTLLFRYSEDGSYYRFGRLSAGGGYGVDFVDDGIFHAPPVPVDAVAAPTPADGDVLEVRQHLDGRVEGLVNGVVVLRFTDLVTNRRSTYYGLATGGSVTRFDDFRIASK